VPPLVALGWPREQIALEWGRKDIALFAHPERTPESCRIVVEGKALGSGLHGARTQVNRYAAELGHPVDVLVTDGPVLRLFRHASPDDPLYLNCSDPRDSGRALLDALRYPVS
jgi:hypothetical protein